MGGLEPNIRLITDIGVSQTLSATRTNASKAASGGVSSTAIECSVAMRWRVAPAR